jgi:hypothetical protein
MVQTNSEVATLNGKFLIIESGYEKAIFHFSLISNYCCC